MARPAKKKKKSEEILVRVGKTGGEVKEYAFEEGATVEDALETAKLNGDSVRVRVNGKAAELDDELEDGDIVMVAGKVKGGKTSK